MPYDPPPTVTLRSDVNLVEVPVVVRDSAGREIPGLQRADFELFDAGKKQTITAFSEHDATAAAGGDTAASPASLSKKGRSAPRFLALFFDDLHTPAPDLQAAKDAATRFVKTSLRPGDRAVVVRAFEGGDHVFSDDAAKLAEEIGKISTKVRVDEVYCPKMVPYEAYLIVNHLDDEVLRAKMGACYPCMHQTCTEFQVMAQANELWEQTLFQTTISLQAVESLVDGMSKLPGQRIILLASSAMFTGNREAELGRLMTKALHANVVINTLDARRMYVTFGRYDLKIQEPQGDGLGALAAGTGGTFFHNNNDLLEGYRKLGMAPEAMYVLGFSPQEASDGKFHKLKVQLLKRGSYAVQARSGYMAASVNEAAPESPISRLDREVAGSETISDLPIRFSWETTPQGVSMVMHVDVAHMHFLNWQNRRAQRLTIVAVLRDSHGAVVAGKRSEFELNLKEASFAELVRTSFTASLTMEAPAGTYTARAVAEDGVDRKFAASSETVQVK